MLHLFIQTWKSLCVCQLNISIFSWIKFGQKVAIWTTFWMKWVILDRRKMTFWTEYSFSA